MSDLKQTPGPWGWQLFGKEWCLVGQHTMRPIVLAVRKGCPTSLVDGLLVRLDPQHPDAKLIASAPDLAADNARLREVLGTVVIAAEKAAQRTWLIPPSQLCPCEDCQTYRDLNAAILAAREAVKEVDSE